MALDTNELFRLETAIRSHAEGLRKHADACNDGPPEVRAHAARLRKDADDFDMIGNLLVGIQSNPAMILPLLREGYQRLTAEYDRVKRLGEQDAA